MASRREAGVLLHPTSLPGGQLRPQAYRFIDWLVATGQSWWQILPLGAPDEHRSPYAAASAFAGWSGLLYEPDAPVSSREVEEFVATHPYWIGGWAAFAGANSEAVADQVRFAREWQSLREYANRRGVRLIGDLPIYVAPGCADHVSHPELFHDGLVAGVPPDDWSGDRPIVGKPDLRLGGDAGHRLPLVDRALPAHLRARRHDENRPLSRLCRVLGDSRRGRHGGTRHLAPRTRPGGVRGGAARAGPAPSHRRGSRRHHRPGATIAR